MIRPLTIATFLLACGSGLYLYQSKHEVQLLDRTIERAVHDTSMLREQSRLLSAEWTMLNDPDRLRQFSNTYLSLKSINPAQFTSLADLDGKLPPPRVEVPVSSTDEEPVSVETAPQIVPESAPADVDEQVLPVPPVPAMRSPAPVTSAAHPSETKLAVARPVSVDAPARPVAAADPHPSDQRPSDQHGAPRITEAHPEIRASAAPSSRPIILAEPRPHSVNPSADAQPAPLPFRPAATVPAPFVGSLLGMARGSTPPAPRPTPVNATYNAN